MRTHGRRRGRLLTAAAVAGAACAAMLSMSGTGPAAAAAVTSAAPAAAALWGPVSRLPGNAALGGDAEPTALACSGVGDCVAAGNAVPREDNLAPPGSLATEKHGVWGKAVPIPGLAALAGGDKAVDIAIESLSCGAPGDCALGGSYVKSGNPRTIAFLATEKNGVWSDAINVPGLETLDTGHYSALYQLSCTGPGDCTAGGLYTITPYQSSPWETAGYVIDEKNGHWGSPVPLPGVAIVPDSIAQVSAVSCASPGNCAAGGNVSIQTSQNGVFSTTYEAFVLQETGGSWQHARLIPSMSELTQLSCRAAGDCTAAGVAGPVSACAGNFHGACPAVVLTEKNGSWGTPRPVITAAQARTTDSSIHALSCASAGNCVAAGSIGQQTMVMQEKNGTWSAPGQLPGVPVVKNGGGSAVTSLACPAAGDCDAGGYYDTAADGKQLGFVATEADGRWGRPQLISFGDVGRIACFSATSCAALVDSWGDLGYQGVIEREPVQATRTTLSASTSRVTYGHEQSLRISVAVSAGVGLPFGTVLVDAGATAVHPILLGSGAGSYTLGSRQLKPGTYHLVARYVGNPYFQRSTSGQRTLTVVK